MYYRTMCSLSEQEVPERYMEMMQQTNLLKVRRNNTAVVTQREATNLVSLEFLKTCFPPEYSTHTFWAMHSNRNSG